MRRIAALGLALSLSAPAAFASTPELDERMAPAAIPGEELIGRWDLTVTGDRGSYPSWMEVKLSGNRALVGAFVSAGGAKTTPPTPSSKAGVAR